MDAQALNRYAPYDTQAVQQALSEALAQSKVKIIVLDDDPTGTQTVHDLYVFTDWSVQSMRSGIQSNDRLFYILTNSRAFSSEKTKAVHKEIAENALAAADDFVLISRSDSTLRGHWPLETQTMYDTLAQHGKRADGEIIYPFFPEGGRYTMDNIHYVRYGDELIPAGETEFAQDKTFGYTSSDLTEWVSEKTEGAYRAQDVICISMEELRQLNYEAIEAKLSSACDFAKVIVNSVSYDDVKVFATALLRVMARGKRFLFRSAAALCKVLGDVSDKPLLTKAEMVPKGNANGGLIIIGSHVQKTSQQLEALRARTDICFIEMNQHLVLDEAAFQKETDRVTALANAEIAKGNTVAVFTRRDRFDLGTTDKEAELMLAGKISDKLISVVSAQKQCPAFIVAKGGITSSDVATKALRIKKALILGQILPGVPVWRTGEESRFPGIAYVIFPGNVGGEDALLTAVNRLTQEA